MRYVFVWIVAALGCSIGPEVGTPIAPPHCASVLPETRNRTYTDADPVIPGDLNDLQDCIAGMKFPSHWRWFFPPRAGTETNIAFDNGGGVADMVRATADNAKLYGFRMPELPEGTRLTAVGMMLLGTHAGETVEFDALYFGGGGENAAASVQAVNPVAAITRYIGAVTPHTLAVGECFYGRLTLPKAGDVVTALGIQIDRL